MQTTDETYQSIISGDHWFETAVRIYTDDNTYTALREKDILSCKITRPGMPEDKPSIGGALSATLDLKIVTPDFAIPRMGKIITEFRARNSSENSSWYFSGTFFIDTRKEVPAVAAVEAGGVSTTTITAYDAMMKAEQDFSTTGRDWPATDIDVVGDIATAIGVSVDTRTRGFLTTGYKINLPTDYTMREVLEHIAGMYGGNFVITPENMLLFVPLYGLDPELDVSNRLYLVCEAGDDNSGKALQFGSEGWYCLLLT